MNSLNYTLFYLSLLTLIHLAQSENITILKDVETWTDDYNIKDNGIDGWKYPLGLSLSPLIGSDRIYHGWFYLLYNQQYLGYFSRQFECEYDSIINVSFTAFFGCDYDIGDGVILYINEHEFEYKIQSQTMIDCNDSIGMNQAMQCGDRYDAGTFVAFNVESSSIEMNAYNTFDIGFRMINLNSRLNQEFGAISDITLMCNKVNESQHKADADTRAPTMIAITDPSDNIACSTFEESTCDESYCAWNQWHQSKCSCSGSDAVDIIFGIGISSTFQSDATEQSNMEQWLIDDVISNIDTDQSRFGVILFDETVSVAIDIDYYPNTDLSAVITDISWVDGRLNYPDFFTESIAQFNSIETPNTQQILVIITDNDPETPQKDSTVCHYRNILSSKGIRVIMVVIDHATTSPNINNYECITQNSFDLLSVIDEDTITQIQYNNLHTITNTLSAALCPHNPIEPSVSPTNKPTVKGNAKVDITVETDANTTETTRIFIVAIIANITGLESTQITVVSTPDGLKVSIVGTNVDIDLAERKVDEIEDGIEDITGKDATVTDIDKTYGDEDDDDNKELKHLLLYLIISVSLLILVSIGISVVCCYCLCIKTKTTKLKDRVIVRGNNYHKHVSIPSKTFTPIVHQIPQPLEPIHVCDTYPETDDITYQLTGFVTPYSAQDVHRPEGDYGITSIVPTANTVSICDLMSDEEDEEEVNKLYFKDPDELSLNDGLEQTMTRGGAEGTESGTNSSDDDNDDDMYIVPKQITQHFHHPQLSFSLNAPHQLVMVPSISAIGQPFNITPAHSANNTMNLSVHNIDLQSLQQEIQDLELSHKLPLPSEDNEDDDVVKDMTHGAKDGEIDHYDIDVDQEEEDEDEDDEIYRKGDNETMNDTIQLTETQNNDESSSDDNHEAMYDRKNKTKTGHEHFEHKVVNIPGDENENQ